MSETEQPTPDPHSNFLLSLEELKLTPEWVKAPPGCGDTAALAARAPRRQQRKHSARPRPAPRPRTERLPKPPAPVPLEVSFLPEPKGFAAMIAAMKHSPRAFALFDVAKLVLHKPERHVVLLRRAPAADGSRAPLFVVTTDENVFLSQEDAVRYLFEHHADILFKTIQQPVEPPRGNFLFVNRCGFTGEILGPPNYHQYQNRLLEHHRLRLPHVPFEQFKARIRTVKDPEAVRAWLESMSTKTEYECVLDAEPKRFGNLVELEKHFLAEHVLQFVTAATEARISGAACRQLKERRILAAVRQAWEKQMRFPLNTANRLRARLRQEGFHFFKDRKGVTYISRVKPKRLESTDQLAEPVRKIVEFIRASPDCSAKQLLEHCLAGTDEPRLLKDLHWLIEDGYVVEFFDGRLWVPEPKPPVAPAPPAKPEPGPLLAEPPSPAQSRQQSASAAEPAPSAP